MHKLVSEVSFGHVLARLEGLMKTRILSIILVIFFMISLISCQSKNNNSDAEPNAGTIESVSSKTEESTQVEVEEEVKEEENVEKESTTATQKSKLSSKDKLKVKGSFDCIVEEILPDYVLDGVTPGNIVVRFFQGQPFILYLNPSLAGKVEVGNSYNFVIKEEILNRDQLSYINDLEGFFQYQSPITLIEYFDLQIASVEETDRIGFDQIKDLQIEKIENLGSN